MQIIRQHAFGAPEVLVLEELELPEPGPGEVRVATRAAAVTFFDIMNRRGDLVDREYYEADAVLPIEPGYQGAGLLEALGPDVTGYAVGDRVLWGVGSGAYATHLNVPASQLFRVPDDIDLGQAVAGIPVQVLLSYKLTHEAYPLQPGDWCLVQSAAGGAGSLITQFARMRGARVIGVVSTDQKAVVAKEAGANEVIVSGTCPDIAAEVKRITGTGVRVVYDGVGKDTFEANLDSLAPRGYLVSYGQSSGFVPPFDLMTLNDKGSVYVTRFRLECFLDEPWPPSEFYDQVFAWMRSGELVIRVDSSYPLSQAAQAHRAVEERRTSGRVLLVP
jgi:NADPH:quinone reductase